MTPKILLLSNNRTERCGVALVGRHLLQACQQAGLKMLAWHSTPAEPLPAQADEFDIIHVNWHAATVGHLKVQDFPAGPKLSIYVHEPASLCNLVERADLVIASESKLVGAEPKRLEVLLPPCLDYSPLSTWDGAELTLGSTGIRRDGLDWVAGAVERQHVELQEQDGPLGFGEVHPGAWRLAPSSQDPDGWLSDEAEIERLASCAMTVFHYHSGNSGQSYAAMLGVAARRPMLLNHNRMLEHLWASPEAQEELYVVDDVASGIYQVVQDLRDGKEKRPWKLAKARSWGRAVEKLGEWWASL